MIAIKLDPTGSHHVRWPVTPSDVITLARRFIARQNALPADQRIKDIPATVQALLTQVEATVQAASTGEAGRATAAETLRQKLEQARPLVALLVLRLKGQYAQNLAQLESWGLSTRQSARGVTVRKPGTPREHIVFLRAYVAKETSLPEAQRLTEPSLATVQALLDEIEDALTTRLVGQDQRELGIEQRAGVRDDLLRWLQIGALHLVMQNGGTVSTALQQHGYTVVVRPANNGGTTNGHTEPPAGDPPHGEASGG